ncbi:hypothetical protein OG506_46290 [Streptomyces sp. NBC_00696]|nr:hypothetical protein [Streptomyces sp. NBC_00696]
MPISGAGVVARIGSSVSTGVETRVASSSTSTASEAYKHVPELHGGRLALADASAEGNCPDDGRGAPWNQRALQRTSSAIGRPDQRRAEDASHRGLSEVEFPHSGKHSGLTDTDGTSDGCDPAVAEGLGLCLYRQATLPLVEVRPTRLELGCQQGPLPLQPAHARATNYRTESHELKICAHLTMSLFGTVIQSSQGVRP